MNIDKIKVGMKVEIPTTKSVGQPYHKFKSELEDIKYDKGYLIVTSIADPKSINYDIIGVKTDDTREFFYRFRSYDLQEYIDSPTVQNHMTPDEAKENPAPALVDSNEEVQKTANSVQIENFEREEKVDDFAHLYSIPEKNEEVEEETTIPEDDNLIGSYPETKHATLNYRKPETEELRVDVIPNNLVIPESVKQQGLRYNEGKLDYTLMDLSAFSGMIEVLEFGAKKYSRDNWKAGGAQFTLIKLLGSTMRHLASLLSGSLYDEESKLPHISHLQCNLMFMGYFWNKHLKDKKAKKKSHFF